MSVFLTCRGLSPWRANELFVLELGRTETFPNGSFQGAEEVTREYGVSVVGPIHSRGVDRVMPVESENEDTRRGRQFNAER